MSALQDAIDSLYGADFDAFVQTRKALAKELKAAGEKDAAAELSKLPKPTAAAWALNHVAREDPDTVGDWMAARGALEEASGPGGDGDALRAAMTEHRAATGRLVAAVKALAQPGGKPLSGAMVDRVTGLLQQATADAALADRLGAGRVTEERAAEIPLPDVPVRRTARAKKATAAPKPDATPAAERSKDDEPAPSRAEQEAAAKAERRAELEDRAAGLERDIETLKRRTGERADAARIADERLEDAKKRVIRFESEAEAAQDAAEEAERGLKNAQRELSQLRKLLKKASSK